MGSLRGLRVVVTRAAHQAEELTRPLSALGAEVLLLPMIEIAPAKDLQPLQQSAANCNRYDWIIFTSTNAVASFASALPPAISCEASIATVGEATRQACEQHGLSVLLMPAKYVAESLVEAFQDVDLNGKRVLIPSAAVTRDVVPAELRKRGALVEVVEAYRNVVPADAPSRVQQILREPYPDWVLFASSSAVTNLVKLAGAERLNRMRIATIGPATTTTAQDLAVRVTVEARTHDVPGLVHAIEAS